MLAQLLCSLDNSHLRIKHTRVKAAPCSMDRQWQRRGRGHYDTLLSQDEFVRQLPPLPAHAASSTQGSVGTGASLGDLYAVFSALHAQCRAPEVRASATGGFYYLLASLPQEALLGGKAGVRQQQALARQQGHAGQVSRHSCCCTAGFNGMLQPASTAAE